MALSVKNPVIALENNLFGPTEETIEQLETLKVRSLEAASRWRKAAEDPEMQDMEETLCIAALVEAERVTRYMIAISQCTTKALQDILRQQRERLENTLNKSVPPPLEPSIYQPEEKEEGKFCEECQEIHTPRSDTSEVSSTTQEMMDKMQKLVESVAVLQAQHERRMKDEQQNMEIEKAQLVARLQQEAELRLPTPQPRTPSSPAARSETSCDSWGNQKMKIMFQEPEVRRSNKDISINLPGHPDHDSMSWTACYDDNCPTHRSDKDGAGWYPSKPCSKPRRCRGNNQKPTLSHR